LLVRAACDAIGTTDAAIDVGQQSKTELFVCRECLVVGGGVERRADDFGVECFEFWASVTEALAFASSTAGRGFRTPRQHDPRSAQVVAANNVVVLVGEREIGSGGHQC
jgi:hypothetical protein